MEKWSEMVSLYTTYAVSDALENADKEQYQNALQLLGAEDNTMMTPLWWAIK